MGLRSTIQPNRRDLVFLSPDSSHAGSGTIAQLYMTLVEKSDAEIVCLVDDDPSVLKSIGRLLTSDGFSVHAFNNPKEFLAHVQTHSVPLVVLDILMDEMNGLEVQAQLCALSPRTRVIIITGCEDANARSIATRLGVIAFFTKPFDGDKFLNAARGALAMHPL